MQLHTVVHDGLLRVMEGSLIQGCLMLKWIRHSGLAGVLLLALSVNAQPVSESKWKAAFIYNVVRFSEWPAETVFDNDTINVCISVNSALSRSSDQLNNRTVNGKRLVIWAWQPSPDAPRLCHVLYTWANDREYLRQIQNDLTMKSVLTIADDDGGGDDGSIITMHTNQKKIVFDINMRAAKKARLSLSSNLLRLARTVQ